MLLAVAFWFVGQVGCGAKLFENMLLVGYVLVPLLFSIIDMPISKSVWSPLMMIRSAPWYILFMPTFVAFFSAYSTNRLADVSWGQRGSAGDVSGQQKMEKTAKIVAWVAVVTNVVFASMMTWLKLTRPEVIVVVADIIMSVAGCTFLISFISYLYHYWNGIYTCFFSDQNKNVGLGDDAGRVFMARTENNVDRPDTGLSGLVISFSAWGAGLVAGLSRLTTTESIAEEPPEPGRSRRLRCHAHCP